MTVSDAEVQAEAGDSPLTPSLCQQRRSQDSEPGHLVWWTERVSWSKGVVPWVALSLLSTRNNRY